MQFEERLVTLRFQTSYVDFFLSFNHSCRRIIKNNLKKKRYRRSKMNSFWNSKIVYYNFFYKYLFFFRKKRDVTIAEPKSDLKTQNVNDTFSLRSLVSFALSCPDEGPITVVSKCVLHFDLITISVLSGWLSELSR